MQPPTKTHLYRQYLRFSLGCLLIGFGLPIGVDALGLPDWLFVLAVCGSFVLAVLLTIETWIR